MRAAPVRLGGGQRSGDVTPNVRRVRGKRLLHDAGAEQEYAGVPVEISGVDIGLRGRQIRLFDEASDGQIRPSARRLACFNVAKAGFRSAGRDAEHNDLALIRRRDAVFHRLPEISGRGDLVVGGDDHDQCVAVRGKRRLTGHGNRRRRVAADGLKNPAPAIQINACQIDGNPRGVPLGSHQKHTRGPCLARRHALHSFHKH